MLAKGAPPFEPNIALTLKMTTAQVVETSVTVNNSPIQDYVHPDDQTQPTSEVISGFKPFTVLEMITCVSQNQLAKLQKHF